MDSTHNIKTHARLFDPFSIRSVTLRNRLMMSPMCQYSSDDGFANDWHLVHLGARAAGGIGLVCTEAAAVLPEGRISPHDLGLWDDAHIDGLERITRFVRGQGAVAAIQLAHSGRKGSRRRPWEGGGPAEPGWRTVAPSPIPWDADHPVPAALDQEGIDRVVRSFGDAAGRAEQAGFQAVEIHASHGYLIHEFLSPLTNHRADRYGGSFENRIRLLLEVIRSIRSRWPASLPLFVRLSVTDWMEWDEARAGTPGWTVEQSVHLCRRLQSKGVDVIDCSSGGAVPEQRIEAGSGYQVGFAERIRRETGLPTVAVGLINQPMQADQIVRSGQADLVAVARQLLRDPHFALRAAHETRQETEWPPQYLRGSF